jgi:hypothetical protein
MAKVTTKSQPKAKQAPAEKHEQEADQQEQPKAKEITKDQKDAEKQLQEMKDDALQAFDATVESLRETVADAQNLRSKLLALGRSVSRVNGLISHLTTLQKGISAYRRDF